MRGSGVLSRRLRSRGDAPSGRVEQGFLNTPCYMVRWNNKVEVDVQLKRDVFGSTWDFFDMGRSKRTRLMIFDWSYVVTRI